MYVGAIDIYLLCISKSSHFDFFTLVAKSVSCLFTKTKITINYYFPLSINQLSTSVFESV